MFLEKIAPFYSGGQRNREGFKAFAEGCEQMELYPFAAHARLKLSLIDPENVQEHLEKFFELIEKSGCKQAHILRQMFVFSNVISKEEQPAQTGDD